MHAILFWSSTALLVYLYAGYPLLIALLARVRPRPVRKGAFVGRVSILIAVHDEAAKLGTKLRSLLDAEDADRIDAILVGSDGSTDDVAGAVASAGDPRVELVAFPERRGKPAVLNDLMPRCRGDVVVLTDARQPLERGALRALLANFADERVGVVSGELVFRTGPGDTDAARGVDAYWRYEKWIRKNESRFRSVPGATGALYAIRRDLLAPIPADTLLDDVAIPMRAVRGGYRCVFEEGAIVYDAPEQSPAREAVRKRRTIAGNAQLVALFPSLLLPWRNPIWLEFVSHKLMRLASPLLLLVALAASLAGSEDLVVRWALWLQLAFYALAAVGWLGFRAGIRLGPAGVPMMFVALNLTTVAALADAATGRYRVTWQRAGGDRGRA